jgi:hypothetical protein
MHSARSRPVHRWTSCASVATAGGSFQRNATYILDMKAAVTCIERLPIGTVILSQNAVSFRQPRAFKAQALVIEVVNVGGPESVKHNPRHGVPLMRGNQYTAEASCICKQKEAGPRLSGGLNRVAIPRAKASGPKPATARTSIPRIAIGAHNVTEKRKAGSLQPNPTSADK